MKKPTRAVLISWMAIPALLAVLAAGCSLPAGQSGSGGIEPAAPVAPEAPVPEADEQVNPEVALTAEASGNQQFVVTIGAVGLDQAALQGVELALAQINDQGGGDGRIFELATAEMGDGDQASAFQELVGQEDAVAVLMPSGAGEGAARGIRLVLSLVEDINTDDFTALSDFELSDASVAAAWTVDAGGEANQRFVEGYRERYGGDPDVAAARAYTVVWMLAEAVRAAGTTDPAEVRQAFTQIEEIDTPFGSMNGFAE